MNAALGKLLETGLGWDLSKVRTSFIKNGLTNENYFVTDGRESYVARIAGAKSNALGIDRSAELAALNAISSTRLAPPLAYFSATTGDMITRFISGRHLTQTDLAEPATVDKVAAAMRKVHSLEIPFESCPYSDITSRLQAAKESGVWLPHALPRLLRILLGARRKLDRDAAKYRGLCHNDLFVGNVLYDGSIWLIDWECAAMGDIFFDLACVCSGLSRARKGTFLRAYFGADGGALVDRLECMEFVVTFWNASWALVQTGTINASCDYEAMARHMFANLGRAL